MQSNFWIFLCQFMLTRMFRNTFKVQKPGVNNWKFSRLDNAKKVLTKQKTRSKFIFSNMLNIIKIITNYGNAESRYHIL